MPLWWLRKVRVRVVRDEHRKYGECSRTPLSLAGARPRGRTKTGVEVSCSPAVFDGTCEAACACRITRVRHSNANSEVVSGTATTQVFSAWLTSASLARERTSCPVGACHWRVVVVDYVINRHAPVAISNRGSPELLPICAALRSGGRLRRPRRRVFDLWQLAAIDVQVPVGTPLRTPVLMACAHQRAPKSEGPHGKNLTNWGWHHSQLALRAPAFLKVIKETKRPDLRPWCGVLIISHKRLGLSARGLC